MHIVLRWRRILASLLIICITGWTGTAAALYSYFKYTKDFEEVAFADMLSLPFRMDAHRKQMGDYHVNKGLEEIQAGNYRNALRLLRLGVARSPGNLTGRSVLAEFFELALKRTDLATELMLEGLEQGGADDLDYLKKTLRLLLRQQMDDKVQTIADNYLPAEAELSKINRTLAFGAANANYLRGNYDRANDYLDAYDLHESLEGLMLAAKINWDRGSQIAAIVQLEQSLENFPNSEPLLMLLSRYYRERGQLDDARRYAILRNVKEPLSLAPRLELLRIYHKEGDQAREQRETQRMLKLFHNDEATLQALSNFACDTGNIDLARRTYVEALENEFNIDSFALLLIEAHLVQKDYQGALDFSEELLKENPAWLTQHWPVFNSLRSLAAYGTLQPHLGEIYLQHFIENLNSAPSTYLAVAQRFSNNDLNHQARKVLTIAHQRKPNHQMILSELIRVDLKLGHTENLNTLLTQLLQMRRPELELLAEAYRKLGSDRFVFTPNRENLLLELSATLRQRAQNLPTQDS